MQKRKNIRKRIKRFVKKAKNVILYLITGTAFVLFLTAGCAIDSASKLPAIVCVLSFGWLGLFAFANGAMKGGKIRG